jgi:hypothetical protein
MDEKEPTEAQETGDRAATTESKDTPKEESSSDVAFCMEDDKIESFDKSGDGDQIRKHGEGEYSEKTTEDHSRESDDTAVVDLKGSPAKQEEKEKSRDEANDEGHLTGVKMLVVLAAVTGACFIMLLDTSIVATVSLLHLLISISGSYSAANRQFPVSRINSTRFQISDGMAVHTS